MLDSARAGPAFGALRLADRLGSGAPAMMILDEDDRD
jgi:hypothetical protein